MDRTCLAAGAVAGEGSFQGGKGTRAEADVGEDLAYVGWSVEVDSGGVLRKLCVVGSARMWKPSLRTLLNLGKPG
jgi:hypothetical protein